MRFLRKLSIFWIFEILHYTIERPPMHFFVPEMDSAHPKTFRPLYCIYKKKKIGQFGPKMIMVGARLAKS